MRVPYEITIEKSFDLPDSVGVNTPDGIKMLHCENVNIMWDKMVRYQAMVTDECCLTVDVDLLPPDRETGIPCVSVMAKVKYGEGAEEMIYCEYGKPDEVLEILGNAFAKAEKEIAKPRPSLKDFESAKEELKDLIDGLDQILDHMFPDRIKHRI